MPSPFTGQVSSFKFQNRARRQFPAPIRCMPAGPAGSASGQVPPAQAAAAGAPVRPAPGTMSSAAEIEIIVATARHIATSSAQLNVPAQLASCWLLRASMRTIGWTGQPPRRRRTRISAPAAGRQPGGGSVVGTVVHPGPRLRAAAAPSDTCESTGRGGPRPPGVHVMQCV
jgi:hypothetical protein